LFTERDEAAHAAERRLVANAYSMSSLLEMEPYVDSSIEELCSRLSGFANTPVSVNMAFWLQAYAFDVVGELAFGRAFGFVASGQDIGGQMANLRGWLRNRFAIGMVPWLFPIFMSPVTGIFSRTSKDEQEDQRKRLQFTADAVKARMDRHPADRRDMLSRFLEAKHPDGTRLSLSEVLLEAGTVVGAGSDTTGISLRAILYYVITNPGVYAKLMDEINTFAREGKISDPVTFSESMRMPYFCAVVKEALRIHSAVGYILPRYVPAGGRTIAGRFFPEGVRTREMAVTGRVRWGCMPGLFIAMNLFSGPRRISLSPRGG
jgi:cytochrome P450